MIIYICQPATEMRVIHARPPSSATGIVHRVADPFITIDIIQIEDVTMCLVLIYLLDTTDLL